VSGIINKMVKIYTKSGDKGETNLLFGGKTSKSDLRVETYGTVDEAVSSLGLAKSLTSNTEIKLIIENLQQSLFIIAAELATSPNNKKKLNNEVKTITKNMVSDLESLIDSINEKINLGNKFIMPGTSVASAAIDVSRTVVRRLERRIVELIQLDTSINSNIIPYINRTSDLLFILGRLEDKDKGIKEVTNLRNLKDE
jgi:cob(I)alamin adenosyltransferase